MLTAPNLAAIPELHHGFFTRRNGHSSGLYKSLNCGLGSDDNRTLVLKNRASCAQALGVDTHHMVTAHQEHTADVVTVTEPWSPENSPVADGLVTRTPGLALAVLAADCVPVLFADLDSKVIGAAHSGWQGALNGVVENTIERMTELGAKRSGIVAAIGPCIGAKSYEVGPEFVDRFVNADLENVTYFTPSDRASHSHFDIGAYAEARVLAAGVHSVERLESDTCAQEDLFFSYRRSCHKGETDYGRQLSGIAWAS